MSQNNIDNEILATEQELKHLGRSLISRARRILNWVSKKIPIRSNQKLAV